MWKVLGSSVPIVTAGDVWSTRLVEMSGRRKEAPRFKELMARADVRYWFDTIKEVHMFKLTLPDDVGLDDLEFMRDFILKLEAASKSPVVEYDGEAQRHSVILTSEPPRDAHKGRNAWWEG